MNGVPLGVLAPNPAQLEPLTAIVRDRACVVLGSAPLKTPPNLGQDECLITINGSLSSSPAMPALWFVGSKWQDRQPEAMKPLHRTMLAQATGRTVGHVILLRGPKFVTESYTLTHLDRLGCRYRSWSLIDKPTKQWLEQRLCGRPGSADPCSSGIFAVAAALYGGASQVRLIGFSLRPGYHYLPKAHAPSWWRGHVETDQRALRHLQQRYHERLVMPW